MNIFNEPGSWFALVSLVAAFLFLVRGVRAVPWEGFGRYLMFLFCLFAGLSLADRYVPPRVIKYVAMILITAASFIMFLDIFSGLIWKLRNSGLLSRFFKQPIPDYFFQLSRALFKLASTKTGAIVVIENRDVLEEHVKEFIPFDSEVNSDVLGALFQKDSAVHDGAVVITGGRISKVKTILPLQTVTPVPMGVGTRHRAAIGITERSDAVAIAVSEERGEVSVASGGILNKVHSEEELLSSLASILK